MGAIMHVDVDRLADACIGWGTNDTQFITILTTRCKRYMFRLSREYRKAYDKDLQKLIKEETSGWYAYLARFIVLTPAHADARLLDVAMDGIGSNKEAIIEFLCGRTPARVRAAKKAWEDRHDSSLVDRFNDELSGSFQRLVLELLKGRRKARGRPI